MKKFVLLVSLFTVLFSQNIAKIELELERYHKEEIKFNDLSEEAKVELINKELDEALIAKRTNKDNKSKISKEEKSLSSKKKVEPTAGKNQLELELKKYYREEIKFRDLSKEGKDVVLNARRAEQERLSASMTSEDKLLLAMLIIGTAAVIASDDGSGGLGSYDGYYNTGYAWDQHYGGYGTLIWRCRDKSNGQWAPDSKCAGKIKSDNTWPDK
tara:strand:- start:247 stop:888 length:642 start_codon:yes stop_codon:yes gene_type:complete